MKSLKIHCFQHVFYEDPGCIATWSSQKGHRISYTRFYEDYGIPEVTEFDWLIVMGGPMGVYDEEQYPWLIAEKELIRKAVENHKTVVGICLGAQLIASALGSRVYRNPEKEIGWFDVILTGEGRQDYLLKDVPPKTRVFHWHGDTFDLPDSSKHLIFSEACKNQTFLFQGNVLGIQFHFEVTTDSIKAMVENGKHELVPGKYVRSGNEILSSLDFVEHNNQIMYGILDKLADLTIDPI